MSKKAPPKINVTKLYIKERKYYWFSPLKTKRLNYADVDSRFSILPIAPAQVFQIRIDLSREIILKEESIMSIAPSTV